VASSGSPGAQTPGITTMVHAELRLVKFSTMCDSPENKW